MLYLTVWGVEPVVTHQTSWLDSTGVCRQLVCLGLSGKCLTVYHVAVAVLCTPACIYCHFSLYRLDLPAWGVKPVVCHVAAAVLFTPARIHCHFSLYRLDLTAWGVEPVVCHVAATVLCTPACIHCHFSPSRLDLTAWGVEPVVCHEEQCCVHLTKKRKHYTFWHQFDEKPSNIRGYPSCVHLHVCTQLVCLRLSGKCLTVYHMAAAELCTPACNHFGFTLYLTGWDVEPEMTYQTAWLERTGVSGLTPEL